MKMKKARFLLATLVCAVVAMGVGYAWWTDSIGVTETAAAGHMEVIFVDGSNTNGTSAYVDATITKTDDKTYTCSFTNLYPGAKARVDLKAINSGTIPVKFNNAAITVTGSSDLRDNIDAQVCYCKLDTAGDVVVGSEGGTELVLLKNLQDAINGEADLKALEFATGEYLALGSPTDDDSSILLQVKDNAPDGIENETLTFDLELNWKQFNE